MNQYRNDIFLCLLVLGGVLFLAHGKTRAMVFSQMSAAITETGVFSDATSAAGANDGESAVNESDGANLSANTTADEDNIMEHAKETQDTVSAASDAGTVSENMAAAGEKNAAEAGKTTGETAAAGAEWSFCTVDESYFDDAVFIGDSRTVGLYDYAGLEKATFYASSGLTVYKLFEDPDGAFHDGSWTENIGTALLKRQFGKIYLMIGINEMGTGDVDYFMKHYTEAVEKIRQLQPSAIIYLESIMRVTTERSAQGDYINNQGIDERNQRIAQLADNQTIFYLDVNSVVCDASGGLNPEYTFDGVHLYAQYIDIWKQYLMEHAIEVRTEP